MSNKQKAAQIQKFIDWEFNIDLATFQNSELSRLATEINKFLELDVSTEELELAENLTDSDEDDSFFDDVDESYLDDEEDYLDDKE